MKQPTRRWLPEWAHPRFPLVANELRKYGRLNYQSALASRQWLRRFSYMVFNPLIFASLLVFFLLVDQQVLGTVLYIPIIFVISVTVLIVEWLYARLWIQIPLVASRMINMEIKNGTWDIIRSTPLPRYQLVLSKLAALAWMSESSMRFILVARSTIILMTVFLYFSLRGYSLLIGSVLQFSTVGLLIVVIPLVELIVLAILGLFMSAFIRSPSGANVLSLSAVFVYRGLAALLFSQFFLDNNALGILFFLMLFPHWTLLLRWVLLPNITWTTTSASTFILGSLTVYLILPLSLGGILLAGIFWRVHHR